VRREFALAGGAYVVGSLVAIAGMLALSGPVGIDAVPIALVMGALVTVSLPLARLRASGWRPDPGRVLREAMRPSAATPIVVGAVAYVVSQLTFVVSIAFAARLGTGAVTTYTYAFFAAGLLVGTSAGSVGVVLAAPIARTWDRRPSSLLPHLTAVSRAGFTLLLPVMGLVAVVGDELVQLLLGNSFDAPGADKLVHTFLWLSGFVLLNVPAIVPAVAAFALGRYRAVAAVALVAGAVHVGGSALAVHFDGLEAVGAATSVTNVVFVGLLTAIVFGRSTGAAALLAGRELLPPLAIAAACFALATALGLLLGGRGFEAGAAAAVLPLYAELVRRLLPQHWDAARRLLQPLRAGLRQPA
jgi:peptidoglycan biosynthesis protein MviN/MurJ (putative lipid II flippase)